VDAPEQPTAIARLLEGQQELLRSNRSGTFYCVL